MLLVDIKCAARTDADIHSAILHQRHGGLAAFNTSLGNTQPSHPTDIKTKFEIRSFLVAGPAAWNSLPDDIRTSPSLIVFRNIKNSFVPVVLQLLPLLSAPVFGNAHAARYVNVIILVTPRRHINCLIYYYYYYESFAGGKGETYGRMKKTKRTF